MQRNSNGRAVLVQRDEHFLRIRGEGVTVERERHHGLLN